MKVVVVERKAPEIFEHLTRRNVYLHELSTTGDQIEKYVAEEVMRFVSFAGTIFTSFCARQEEESDDNYLSVVEQRNITHILTRTLIEKFFKILWLFNEPPETENRYQAILDDFKEEYRKLYNDRNMPSSMQQKLVDLSQLKAKNTNIRFNIADIVIALKNKNIAIPDYVDETTRKIINEEKDIFGKLYYLYRITSFDTHGNNSRSIISSSFGKNNGVEIYDFPFVYIDTLLLIMTVKYNSIIDEIQNK